MKYGKRLTKWNPYTRLRTFLTVWLLSAFTMAAATGLEQSPEFPGGEAALMAFIKKNLKYPASAAEDLIQGRVTLSFSVEEDGSITNIEVMRSPDERLSQEAIRIVKKMPKWKPGTQRGKPCRVKYVLPIKFSLGFNDIVIEKEFPGGEKALDNYIQYNRHFPPSAQKRELSRIVDVRLFIEKDGSVSDSIIIEYSLDDALSAEAINLVKNMPKWTPEWRNGRPARSSTWLRIEFDVMEAVSIFPPEIFGPETWRELGYEPWPE